MRDFFLGICSFTASRLRRVGLSTLCLGLSLFGLSSRTLLAADPQLGRIVPYGAERGTEAEIQFVGARLADAEEVLFYEPGVQVKAVEAGKPDVVKARLAIDSDCRLGPHALRLRTASGISRLVTFSVGALKEVREAEPNNEPAQAQKIELGTTVNGVVEDEGVDYYVVRIRKGQRITAEVEGIRLGRTFFDPSLAILDSNRSVLAAADDTPLVWQDAIAATVAPKDGDYLIMVRESAFGGSSECDYRLHVGEFPRPLAVYPIGGKPGETLSLRWIGDPAGDWTEQLQVPAAPQDESGLFAHDAKGIAPWPNPFRLVELDNVMETEPNDSAAQATALNAPAALNGVIGRPGDVDCFKFAARKDQEYDVRVYARQLRSPLDSVLTVIRAGGAGVGANDDTETPDSYLRFHAPADDQYVIILADQLGKGGSEYVYRIEVTSPKPQLTMGLVEREAFVDVTAPVPQGNHFAAVVSVQRTDFGGQVNLEIKGMPAGITVETIPVAADESAVPVLFTAIAGARPGGSLADIVGRWSDGKQSLEGHLRQRTSMVRGQNNREVWNHYSDRMAVAVTRKSPFQIEIVQPKVPLVRDGSMELKVIARRDAGFNAPISLAMLYNPEGVSSPTTVTMPGDKNEAILPLTANSGAKVKNWRIAVVGEAPVGDGPVAVSTPLAALDVAEPLFKFTFPTVTVEQGQEASLVVGVQKLKDFEGAADVELVGLPNEVTSQAEKINKDSMQVTFPIKTTAKSPVGNHKVLRCRAVAMANGEPITHLQGTGELRIFPPSANRPADTKSQPEAKQPAARPLSRLEELRRKK